MGFSKLHEKIQLYVDDGTIILAPQESEDVLVIDRVTFKVELQGTDPENDPISADQWIPLTHHKVPILRVTAATSVSENIAPKPQEIFGCLGLIDLFSGPYLIVVSQREEVGTISGIPIFEVTKASIIQVAKHHYNLTEDEKKLEKDYISLLSDFMEDCGFYFSYEYDITHTAQRLSQMSIQDKAKSLWERVDERFFWNKHLHSRFISNKLDQFILPVVDGFIKMVPQMTHESNWKYIFISRRGCLRTGARYHTRGADPLGNVANFVETEQIIEYANILSSYVQVRGSIPFFWQQKGKGLKPRPVVDISSSAEMAFRRHMEGLVEKYGPVAVVSLIDQRGIEVSVGESFETHMYILNNMKLKYVAFDFHEKCKNNKYENLSLLMDQVGPDLSNYSYFLRDEGGNPVLKQTGIVRTNCIDCLDRTNVVQSVFARQVLLVQLNHLGILGSNEKLEQHPSVENMFKNVWADNADIMSEQYTGTVALKTDFTRTGKRSVKGSVMDGVNSAKRYINKSFKDDEKQEVIDLFLGHFVVEKWNYDVIEEGTYRFMDLSMINEWTSKGMSAIMQVNLNTRTIMWYLLERGQRTDIPFESLIQIEKAARDYKMLRIHHSGSPHPVRFQFPTASIREQFTQLLYFSHPPLNPTYGFTRRPEKPFLNLRIFIGTWNMKSTEPSSEDLPVWIPKDKDFYAIGTQFLKLMPTWKLDEGSTLSELGKSRAGLLKAVRRKSKSLKINANTNSHEEHKVPAPYSMPCKEYWHLMIRQYLGPDYIALATINTEETSLIVLVRQSMCSMVNNLEVTPVKIRQKPAEEKKGGLAKLKEAREKLKDQMKTAKEKNDVFGSAALFRFVDTSFCMINYSMDNGSSPASNALLATVDTDESVMHLKGDYDLHNDFHHVFWFGNLPSHSSSQSWVSLYSHEENTGGNAVIWRALHDAPMLSEIEVGNATPISSFASPEDVPNLAEAAASAFLATPNRHSHHPSSPHTSRTHHRSHSAPSNPVMVRPNPPAFAQAAVGIFIPPLPLQPLLSRNHYCTMTLSRLVCTQAKPDLYLVCHAPFLVFPGRTGFSKKGDGCWAEEITVRSFIIDREYIDMLHLRLELWERGLIGDEDRLAVGMISIKSAGDIQPLPFVTSLWTNNEILGEVSGEISLSFQENPATYVEPDPPISADPNHPWSPPMTIPNFVRSPSSESPPPSPHKSDHPLSPPNPSSSSSSPNPAPSGAPSGATSGAPTSALSSTFSSSPFGSSFFKLPFPQLPTLGPSREASSRLSFFGKAAGHRELLQESRENSPGSSSESIPILQEDLEISQPLTSPTSRNTSRNTSRAPSPSFPPSPARSAMTTPSRSTSSSPVPPGSQSASMTSLPSVDLTDDADIPPPLPPKPKRNIIDFSPIPSLSPSIDSPTLSDLTAPLIPTPISAPTPLTSPPLASPRSTTDSPNSESEGGAKNLISRIARFGFSIVRSASTDNLQPSPLSASSPSLQRRPPSATPQSQYTATSPPPSATSPPPTLSPPLPHLPEHEPLLANFQSDNTSSNTNMIQHNNIQQNNSQASSSISDNMAGVG